MLEYGLCDLFEGNTGNKLLDPFVKIYTCETCISRNQKCNEVRRYYLHLCK